MANLADNQKMSGVSNTQGSHCTPANFSAATGSAELNSHICNHDPRAISNQKAVTTRVWPGMDHRPGGADLAPDIG